MIDYGPLQLGSWCIVRHYHPSKVSGCFTLSTSCDEKNNFRTAILEPRSEYVLVHVTDLLSPTTEQWWHRLGRLVGLEVQHRISPCRVERWPPQVTKMALRRPCCCGLFGLHGTADSAQHPDHGRHATWHAGRCWHTYSRIKLNRSFNVLGLRTGFMDTIRVFLMSRKSCLTAPDLIIAYSSESSAL